VAEVAEVAEVAKVAKVAPDPDAYATDAVKKARLTVGGDGFQLEMDQHIHRKS
jgi:hypothetical protein